MKKHLFLPALVIGFLLPPIANAATIVGGDVTTNPTFNSTFFFDAAATGGGDFNIDQPNTATFARDFGTLNVGTVGTTITINGIGWASGASATANDATTATVAIIYQGLDGATGGGDDVVIGTVTDFFTYAGAASEYVWVFDMPITAVIDAANINPQNLSNFFRVAITPLNDAANGSLRFKTTSGSTAANVKLSVAGSSAAIVPEPGSLMLVALGMIGLLLHRRVG